MPEAETVVEENLDGQAQDTTVAADNAPGQENASVRDQLILGKFKTSDDLAKSYTEVEAEKGRLANELGKLRTEIEAVKSQNEMAKAIASLAEARKPKDEPKDANLEEFLSELEADGVSKAAAKKLIGLSENWLASTEKKMKDEVEATRKELQELRRQTYDEMERMSPDYQQNKPLIDEMVAGGMSIASARSLVRKLSEADASAPVRLERAVQPSAIAPSRVIPKAQTPAHNDYLLTLDELRSVRTDLTEDNLKKELTRLNGIRLERIKQGQDQRDSIYKRSAIA